MSSVPTKEGMVMEGEANQSMVQKHQQKLHDQKFAKGAKVLKRRVPQVHALTRDFALEYTNLEVNEAERLLRMFLQTEKRTNEDDDGNEKENDEGRRSRRKRRREKRHGNDKEEGGRRRHRHKRRGKEDRGKNNSDGDDDGAQGGYGKFGILKESDLNGERRTEFIIWAKEVKAIEIENLARWEEKKLFSEFMDLYNTATLPSAKYYDMDAWHYKEQAKREAEASAAGGAGDEKLVFDDEKDRKEELLREKHSMKNKKIEAARRELLASGKLTMMREQERLRAAQQVAYRTGDMKQARDIAEILRPSEDDQVEWDAKTGKYRKRSKLNS